MRRLILCLLAIILIALTKTSTAQVQPALLVYPYLGETTATSVVISWATDSAGSGEVRYSLDQSYSHVVAAVSETYDGKYWHAATIAGLTAGTTYYYRVYMDGGDVTPWPEITFTTAPESTASPLTLVALGDSRPSSPSAPPSHGALDVAAEMEQHSFDLAIHTGDIVHSGGICSGHRSSWNQYIRAYFDLYREITGHIPFYPSVGNHELGGGSCGYQGYTDVYDLPDNAPSGYEEEYYSFDWGNAHFVALDTNQSYSTGSAQYDWLVDDLQTSAQSWKFVFFHHPAYSSGPHGSTSGVQTHLVPVFEAYGVDIVFNGHDHTYERTCPILNDTCTTPQDGGVVYYVTGGGGASLYSVSGDWFTEYGDSVHHFLKVEVNDCRLRVDAIDTNGSVFDSYEIDYCSPTPPIADAGADQIVATYAVVRLDGSGSYDPDGDDLTYGWAQSGGPSVALSDTTAVSPTFTAPGNPAVLTFTLTVTDSLGLLSAPDTVVIIVSEPDLAISKVVDSTGPLQPGQSVTYRLAFSNTGSFTATGVLITDTIPVSVTDTSVISSGVLISDTGASPGYVWQVAPLAFGRGGVITISGVLSSPLAAGRFTNTATIGCAEVESDIGDNSSEAGVEVQNVAPVADDAIWSTDEDNPLHSFLSAGDANGDPLVYDILTRPVVGTVAITDTIGGGFVYTPTNQTATYMDTFIYIVTDIGNLSDTATVTIVVSADNDPPEFSSTPVETAAVGVLYTYAVTTTDVDAGDVLTLTAPARPAWLNLTQTSTRTAILTGTPTAAGGVPVELYVTDGEASATQAFTITVSEYRIYLPLVHRQTNYDKG